MQRDRLGLAGQPPHMDTIHINQPAILLSHINKPASTQTGQPNEPMNIGRREWPLLDADADRANTTQMKARRYPLPGRTHVSHQVLRLRVVGEDA